MDESSAMADGGDDGSIARVAGNRAGVVEWANDAFSRLTGIPLSDTLHKPVTRFLERAGIELEVVDFVAQHFFEGRPCRLEFPFERPDGRRIDVLLEVEALRDAEGEIDRFQATAREQAPPRGGLSCPPETSTLVRGRGPASTAVVAGSFETPLGPAIRRVVASETREERAAQRDSEAWLLDLDLADEPLAIQATGADLEALIADLLQAARASLALADQGWGTITLTTGRATPGRGFRSTVHAIPAYPPELASASRIYLEVHDTGPPRAAEQIAKHRDGDGTHGAHRASRPSTDPADLREDALARAVARARALGAIVHLDGTPGCGNQTLVLFPT